MVQLTMYEAYSVTAHGEFYDYVHCARGLMIARAQSNLTSMDGMEKLLRLNQYQTVCYQMVVPVKPYVVGWIYPQ